MRGAGLGLALLLAACAPTASELLIAGQWSASACLAVADRALCEPAQACSAAVQALASEGAKRSLVAPTAQACILPRRRLATLILGLDGLGALVDEIGRQAAGVLAERENVRQLVLQQAGADLNAERVRCGQ